MGARGLSHAALAVFLVVIGVAVGVSRARSRREDRLGIVIALAGLALAFHLFELLAS